MKVRMTFRDLSDDEILEVGCSVCKREPGDWCTSLREPNLFIKKLHMERVRLAYRKAQARDYRKAQKRMQQIRGDTVRYNAERHELAQWIVGGQLYAWLKEYGSILWKMEGKEVK